MILLLELFYARWLSACHKYHPPKLDRLCKSQNLFTGICEVRIVDPFP